MKFIHTGDLHLGSKMGTRLTPDKAAARKAELRSTFKRMADYASENGCTAVLLCGDVFDENEPLLDDKNYFYHVVSAHPDVYFAYLKGNHDTGDHFSEDAPENLLTFGNDWRYYELGDVRVYGTELPEKGARAAAARLSTDSNFVNIVMLHGQIGSSADSIVIQDYAGKGIDYLALGHVHSYSKGQIDMWGEYAYCGTPEGRGFDETGEKGFVLVETDRPGARVETRFVPFAQRTVHEFRVDISGTASKEDALDVCEEAVSGAKNRDLVRLLIEGATRFDTDGLDTALENSLGGRFFALSVKNLSTEEPDYEAFLNEVSLRGEFARKLAADTSLSDADKKRIAALGFKALAGNLREDIKVR